MAKLMNWLKFEQEIKEKKLFLFTPLDIRRVFGISKIATTFFLHRYTKRGPLIRHKRGLYSLKNIGIPDLYLANKLYEPSYVSLEFALSYHRVIPEVVYEITSVTTKKTQKFIKAPGRIFTYRSIKRSAFTGYVTNMQRGFTFLIADPEKAFVDLTYLRIIKNKKPLSRFNKNRLNSKKALYYANLFNNIRLTKIIKTSLKLKSH